MTGVPVIPNGSMLPHGSAESGTGRPRTWVQTIVPERASIASTVSFSVATISIPETDPGGCQ